jgi:transposase-like protein
VEQPKKKFSMIFIEALDGIIADGHVAGVTLTSICRQTGISRATPDRWRKVPPKTIRLLDEMQDMINAKLQNDVVDNTVRERVKREGIGLKRSPRGPNKK